jgi:hypothetical protein
MSGETQTVHQNTIGRVIQGHSVAADLHAYFGVLDELSTKFDDYCTLGAFPDCIPEKTVSVQFPARTQVGELSERP